MQADEGSRVRISYICRLEDGTVYDIADRDTLEFIIGQGNTLPTLEMGVIGMKPGEHRVIRVPAAEADEFPFEGEDAPTESHFPAGGSGTGFGYDFAPDDGAEVILTPPLHVTQVRETRSAATDLFFDVDMIEVTDADVDLPEI